jgi:hypothetical protein
MMHVVGNVAVDTVVRMARFPQPGETIIADGADEDMGGKGSNQAVVIARPACPCASSPRSATRPRARACASACRRRA